MTEKPTVLQQMRERFGRHAQDYVASEGHAKGSDLGILLKMANPQKHWIALDVAVGGGHTALKIGPYVDRVIAIDLSDAMLRAAREHVFQVHAAGFEYVCANAELLPFQSETFDLLTCRIAAHHFEDAHHFFQESWRVLRKGGRMVLQDHVLPDDSVAAQFVDSFERLRDPTHNRAFSEKQWRAAFRDSGFRLEHNEIVEKRHRFLPWAERQSCSQETIDQLMEMVENAPQSASLWLAPRAFGKPEATFVNHHIVISGDKAGSP